ncbi:TetR family transcriptional regulator [Streptomyces sp. NBRC 13847]|uniref:TetR/AcrR family transcriptional regulator n=1 Tax=Streptomyces TaxID=1883 RepID=UPI0024A00BE3|nr:TetR/AcrR family transcriptional regulator [Streptomyces sp. NBRC 13847]GLW19567.1 TetR family transcriptional regulator [Streptomyces sp. NBRC 13847]
MAGLRERKKEETRRRIAATAWRLFAERGFEAVTVNEIAEAAQVAKATLFSYFPTKESLALQGVGDDDLAGIVTGRAPGSTPLGALRAHFRALAAGPMTGLDPEVLVSRVRVIFDSPALSNATNSLLYQQRERLAQALTAELGERTAVLAAAQISASVVTLQEGFFRRLADGTSPVDARVRLGEEIELAFDLLTHGLGGLGGHDQHDEHGEHGRRNGHDRHGQDGHDGHHGHDQGVQRNQRGQ